MSEVRGKDVWEKETGQNPDSKACPGCRAVVLGRSQESEHTERVPTTQSEEFACLSRNITGQLPHELIKLIACLWLLRIGLELPGICGRGGAEFRIVVSELVSWGCGYRVLLTVSSIHKKR
jgi:hypothetical protein